ncbi:MAG: PIG-L family deacetylase [Hymenobacteraceae bacterium]|nr:PIG-L family deacetylase [Hymenobacteraceae bacterium]
MRFRFLLTASPSSLGVFVLFALLSGAGRQPARAQSMAAPARGTDAAATALALEKLSVLGSVLYVAAHPDDENTRLIAWLANEKLVRTGYLSLTRGDGGQNLIGSELRAKLGLIRTQELLAARRIDGGEQFFTRANDFGFSKTPAEALRIWDKEQVLADVVRTIRRFRPDVIITRFSPQPMPTHGHHTASAQLAVEAFAAAADPRRFPEQLGVGSPENLQPWQAKRILWNTSAFFFDNNPNFDKTGLLTVDAGGYNALLGKSYGEIAALSRSQHRSQGFGSAGTRGEAVEYFQPLAGAPISLSRVPAAAGLVRADLLEGVDLTWNRLPNAAQAAKVGKLIQKVIARYDVRDPAASVPALLAVRRELLSVKFPGLGSWAAKPGYDIEYWRTRKLADLDDVIRRCAGLYLLATAGEWAVGTTQSAAAVRLKIEAVCRTYVPVRLEKLTAPALNLDTTVATDLAHNQALTLRLARRPTSALPPSQPYWLRTLPSAGMYEVTDQGLIGAPENAPLFILQATVQLGGSDNAPLHFPLPVEHRWTDPALGELRRPVVAAPPVAVRVLNEVIVFADTASQPLRVQVRARREPVAGYVKLQLQSPTAAPSWTDDPDSRPARRAFALPAGADTTLVFQLRPQRSVERRARVVAVLASHAGAEVSTGEDVIHYPHIPEQVLFPEATARLVRADVRRGATNRVGYVVGAGDDVPAALRGLGYTVTLLSEGDLTTATLRTFDAVVLGIRAWNTLAWLAGRQPALLEYVRQGGTLITQYNTSQDVLGTNLGPYPLKLANKRITDETAVVEFLHPTDPLLLRPNRLTPADFQGWVQEQGLYYPEVFDPKYTALLRSHDPDEPPLDGALLVARYGTGTYVYTGLSFFRQLPAGVPGALRLFANLLAGSK